MGRDSDRGGDAEVRHRRNEPEERWRDVRIKEEPISDVEGGRHQHNKDRGSSSHHRQDRSDKNHHDSQRDRRHRSRSRDRERERDRDDRRRHHSRSRSRERDHHQRKPSRRERSRSGQRNEPGANDGYGGPSNDNRRNKPYSDRQDRNRGDRGSRGGGGGRGDRRPAREKDWDNFFNPNTKIKAEKEEDEHSKFGKKNEKDEPPPKDKEKPNFGLSGKLTEETNTFRGVVIKYSEPPEARKPQRIRWRLYPFKGDESLDVMYIHRQSAYLLGRDRKIADIPVDHPSCSKQHAVIQYRLVPYKRKDGSNGRRIKPYIIDLESGNGTYVNGDKIEPKRYVELFEKDVLKFGYSSREYVILNEHTKADVEDDEPGLSSPEVDEKVKIKAEKMED